MAAKSEDKPMNESTARAERFDLPSSPATYFSWEVAGKPVRVRMRMDAIDRLEREAVESFRSLTSRGSEIGGVLLGKFVPGDPMVVSVEDFELISCDYARGPLYRLADSDLERFDRTLAESGGRVVGFLRSHTRKGLTLDGDDLAVLDSRFREPHQVALLIRPFASKPSTGGFFIRENGSVVGEASYLEFPFRASQLAPSKEEPLPEAPPPAPAKVARVVPIASRREPAAVPPPPEIEKPKAENPAAAVTAEPASPSVAEPEGKPSTPQETSAPPAARPDVPTKSEAVPKAEAATASEAVQTSEAAVKPAAAPKPETGTRPEVSVKPMKQVERSTETLLDSEPKAASPASAAPSRPLDDAPAFGMMPEESSGKGKITWIAGAAAIAALVAVVLFIYPGVLRHTKPAISAPIQDSSPLSLRVERSAGELLLTWNRDSDAIRNASHAVLSISDGPQRENIDMDLAQLRTGSIVYSPATGDVIFRMEVSGQGTQKTSSESVRVLRTRPSPLDAPAEDAGKLPQAPGKPATDPAAGAPAAAGPDASGADTPAETPAPKTPDRPLRPFQADSLGQRLRPVSSTDLPDAPAVGSVENSTPTASALNLNSVSAPAATAPAPQKAAAPEPRPMPGGQIQKAELIRRKDPEYPKIARDSGAKGAVELLATIGKDGRVKSVKPVRGHPMLVKPAMDAVMQWVYKPTLLNGQAVETQTQIVLNFIGNDR
jgi:TonB family protein